jgi:hypothetical protein
MIGCAQHSLAHSLCTRQIKFVMPKSVFERRRGARYLPCRSPIKISPLRHLDGVTSRQPTVVAAVAVHLGIVAVDVLPVQIEKSDKQNSVGAREKCI